MKKNIKFVGIAAATLLAVAPVVTPVVDAATMPVAATTNNDAKILLHSILESRTITSSQLDNMNIVSSSKDFTWNQVKNMPMLKTLAGNRSFDADFANTHMNFDYTVNGTPARSTEVFRNFDRLKREGGRIGIHIVIRDNANKLIDEGNYTLTITKGDVLTKTTAINVNFNSIKAPLNSDIEDTQFAATFSDNGGKVLDQNSNPIADDSNILVTSDVYKLNTDGKLSDPLTTSKFTKEGTYYQYIEVSFDKTNVNLSTIDLANILINGKAAKSSNYLAGNVATNTLVFVRTINVGNNNAYTDAKAKGIATVQQLKAPVYSYNAKKHAMVLVAGKTFDKNSMWYTDKTRTITANGTVYRRVSTNEWLKSTDVKFTK